MPAVVELALMLLFDLISTLEFGRTGCHDIVAAFAAAGGGRLRMVVAILPPAFGSFGFERKVLSIPPCFFSGLGVRSRSVLPSGGCSCGNV